MPPRVLEYVRSRDAVWNLPAPLIDGLRARFPDVEFHSARDRAEADRVIADTDVVLGFAARPENFAAAKRLRWIHVTSAAVSGFLFPALVESGVVLTNSRGLHAGAMAEHTIGVLLSFVRKLHRARDAQAAREWAQERLWREPPGIASFAGSTLGIVGLGAIGGAIARSARALGARVLAVRRRPSADPAPADGQWGLERLPDLLERSDFVVLAAPLTPSTANLIGARELARMKPGAFLVNLGRGALVDERALIDALERGRIAGAGLDVTEEEPLPPESPLWSMPDVILTPHVSGLGPRYWERALEIFESNLVEFLSGRPLANVVDKREGY